MTTTDRMDADHDPLTVAQRWLAENRLVVLATVVSTWGSSPRPIGSQMVVDQHCQFVGSVSGGCVETAVIQEALAVMDDGKPRLLEFGVSNDRAWEVGLACGGRIQVFIEAVR